MQPSHRPGGSSVRDPFVLARVGLVAVFWVGALLGLLLVYFTLPLLILPAFLGVYLVWRFKGHRLARQRGRS